MQIYMEPNAYASAGLEWPSDAELIDQVKKPLEEVLETFTGEKIHITSAVGGVLPAIWGLESAMKSQLSREVNITFAGDFGNGQAVFDQIQRQGPELTQKIVDGYVYAALPWAQYVTVHDYAIFTYDFTSSGAGILRQKTGHQRGKVESDNGTPAFKVSAR